MVKNFVLDTNVMIHCPESLLKFEDNNIYIPHPVIEELDNLKTSSGEVGYSARETFRIIKKLRDNSKNNLSDGVDTPGGGKLFIYLSEAMDMDMIPDGWSKTKPDNLIILSALELSAEKENVYIVTNDTNVQIKAESLGIPFQAYQNDRVSKNIEIYSGRTEVHLNQSAFVALVSGEEIDPSEVYEIQNGTLKLIPNQFLVVKTWENGGWLAKYENEKIVNLEYKSEKPFDLYARNAGQSFLQEALLSDKPLTICLGPAGTGKTLFALGCGLEQTVNGKGKYKSVLLCRPNVTMDEDIGFLPGTEFEKISPLLRGAYDNLKTLLANEEDSVKTINDKVEECFDRGWIETESIAYMRGRSITDTYIIIDEAQNATPNQILSIVTRLGEGSKIVLLGDPNQIDNNHLDKWNNGLVYACERIYDKVLNPETSIYKQGENLVEICSFAETECTRSPLAKMASQVFKK